MVDLGLTLPCVPMKGAVRACQPLDWLPRPHRPLQRCRPTGPGRAGAAGESGREAWGSWPRLSDDWPPASRYPADPRSAEAEAFAADHRPVARDRDGVLTFAAT